MPVIQPGQTIWTWQDAIEYVLDTHDLDRTGLNQRRARYAVLEAYNHVPLRHPWTYLIRQRLLQTVASYSTGTLAYVHTGGTFERQLTLAGGTWPSWAAYGRVIIDGVHYEVEERKSATVVTLSSLSNPGSDITSGSFTIYRNSYPLPVNFREFCQGGLCERSESLPIEYVGQTQHHRSLQDFDATPSTPRYYTFRATGKYQGAREILFGPPPNALLTYDLLFHAHPRPLAIDDYSKDTVSLTANDATVTGAAGITFPTGCVGSILRLAASGGTKPTPLLGSQASGDNPFAFQAVIAERTNATTLELSEAPTAAFSNVGYVISDPLDIDANVMLTAVLRHAEAEFARLAGRKDYADKAAAARQALSEALEADATLDGGSGGRASYDPFKHTTVTSE